MLSQLKLIEPSTNDEMRWQAVVNRNPALTERFLYGVLSTGVYCRPECPSRLPRRENVRFFDNLADAQASGLRACKRCQPDQSEPQQTLVDRICAHIDAHPEDDLSLTALSREFSLSPAHLQRTFKKLTGLSPYQYAKIRRLQRLKEVVRESDSVLDALYEAGIGSSRGLYESTQLLGMTPGAYKRGGKNVAIRYTIAKDKLGWLLVAQADKGICKIALGDSFEGLEADLRAEFPNALLHRDESGLNAVVAQITAYLERQTGADLALDPQGTPFQRQVWEALRQIPAGQTRSYQEVARQIGRPEAVRAVANACGANPIALLIPCHRVVRGDGSLGGYRWGVERKRQILALEKSAGD
jgi:AraC family transcriptional regulator, regulatory protein of adaptative response / methylated-DNA-[protein]-cysteine methyltransferase